MIDLHTHSTFSDGTLTPTQLVQQAQSLGVTAIALTDHNTVQGLPEFMAAGEGSGVTTIPGVEFSTEYEGTELHILALYVESAHYPVITRLLEDRKSEPGRPNVGAFLNHLTQSLARIQLGGVAAVSERRETEDKIVLTITIPK